MSEPHVFRFAPSPNGYLHLGHALSALTGYTMARAYGGRFLLRIEDIDAARSRPELVQAIFDDLTWLGLAWEEPVLRQSQHMADYRAAAERLIAMGLLYPCFASRTEIASAAGYDAPRDPDGATLYPGLHRHLSPSDIAMRTTRGDQCALRLDIGKARALAATMLYAPLSFQECATDGSTSTVTAHPERWGDVVLVRKDTPTSYHLAVVVDDARQGVTFVTRGMDLFAATDIHRLLQALLGYPAPLYHHHRLLTDADGRKLSKRAGDTALRQLRAEGLTPRDLWLMLGFDPASAARPLA